MKLKPNLLLIILRIRALPLIELLVVIAIIALLSSIALIALMSARQKSRDVKRLSDRTQMNTALELFYTYNRGYPSEARGPAAKHGPNFYSLNAGCSAAGRRAPVTPFTQPLPAPSGHFRQPILVCPKRHAGQHNRSLYRLYLLFCLGNLTGNFTGRPAHIDS